MPDAAEEHSSQKGWPYAALILCLIWAFLTLAIFTPRLDGAHNNNARGIAQVSILAVVTARIIFAACRREKNRIWWLYFWGLFLAVPIWLIVVEPLWDLLGPIYNNLTRTHP